MTSHLILTVTSCFLVLFLLVKDENKFDLKKIVSDNWTEPPKRERKRKYVSSIAEIMSGFTFSLSNL